MAPGRLDPWLRFGALALLLLALIAPLPSALLDLLLVANLAASLVVLAACAAARPPRLVSALPAVLLGGTLARVALELAASRMILRDGEAGAVIAAFGAVAARGDALVGAAVFVILTAVQFLVVVQGGERVAEVAARFALDAMPGQQLAIDGAVRAGSLDARMARHDRSVLEARAQRAGAMDGAMRFVKGDALAGVLIVVVNLVAGTALGVLRGGLPAREAAERYATLAIGQGLAAQVPSMLLAVAAALSVSRPLSRADDAWVTPTTLRVVAGVMLLVALAPGFPAWPFVAASVALAVGSLAVRAPAAAVGPDERPAEIDVDDTEHRLDALSARAPALVRTTVPACVGPLELTALRRWLAEEGLPLDDLRALLDAVSRVGAVGDPVGRWRARVRVELGAVIGATYAPAGALSAWMLGPSVEEAVRDELARRPALGASLVEDLRALVAQRCPTTGPVTILASVDARRAVWEALRTMSVRPTVLAPEEIGDAVSITVLGVLDPTL